MGHRVICGNPLGRDGCRSGTAGRTSARRNDRLTFRDPGVALSPAVGARFAGKILVVPSFHFVELVVHSAQAWKAGILTAGCSRPMASAHCISTTSWPSDQHDDDHPIEQRQDATISLAADPGISRKFSHRAVSSCNDYRESGVIYIYHRFSRGIEPGQPNPTKISGIPSLSTKRCLENRGQSRYDCPLRCRLRMNSVSTMTAVLPSSPTKNSPVRSGRPREEQGGGVDEQAGRPDPRATRSSIPWARIRRSRRGCRAPGPGLRDPSPLDVDADEDEDAADV